MEKRNLQHGDCITYEMAEEIDDREMSELMAALRRRDLVLADDGCDRVVVWLYRQDGSCIAPESPPSNEATQDEQPIAVLTPDFDDSTEYEFTKK